MLLAGKLDLAIMSTSGTRPPPGIAPGLRRRAGRRSRARTIASRKQTHVRLSDLRDETLYVYPPKEESRVLQEVLVPSGHVPARVEEVS